MKVLVPLAGYIILFAVIWHNVATYKQRWDFGPKYHMPVALIEKDGRHLDGTPADGFTLMIARSGVEEEMELCALSVLGVIALWAASQHRKKRQALKPNASLDVVLLMWNRVDVLTRRMLLAAGILIMGKSGSGKTSSSGRVIARAIVEDPQSSMLILAATQQDKQMWQQIFAEKKRKLLIFEPGGNVRCNMIDFIQRMGGDTREVVDFMLTAGEVLRGESQGGGEYGSFFQDEKRRYLHHGVEILRQAGQPVSAPNLQRFISGAALSVEQRNSEEWREDFHNGCLRAAAEREKSSREKYDFELAVNAWGKEWVVMADKTRSCVLAEMLNTLFHFNSGIARELISTTTNCSPLDMLNGSSILVNAPACEYGLSGVLTGTSWKFLTQKVVLARQFKPGDFYNVIWADEAWQVTTSFDQHYVNTSRSHGGAMVYLVQSRDSFYAALGQNKIPFANGLMSAFHHKIFHVLGSAQDAEYASSHLGQRRELFVSGQTQPEQDLFDAFTGNMRFSATTSEQYQNVLQPRVFLSDLRSGGPENHYLADAIVIRTGEPFKSTGQNFIKATFSQRS